MINKINTVFHNDLFLKALRGEATSQTPVWLMRQAGRYLPEYRATRAKAGSFLALCKNPDLACEVTLQPIDRFGFDAAILFSDILTVPDALGLGLGFVDGEGPRFARPVRDEQSVMALQALTAATVQERLGYVPDAVRTIKQALQREGKQRVPLIGFSGSPWTLACYMVEGQGSDDFRLVKAMLYSRPDLMRHLLTVNTQSVVAYLNAQIDAGADAVMIFDTWGGVLPDGVYQNTSLAAMKSILQQLKPNPTTGQPVPSIIFTKGGGVWLNDLLSAGANAVGLDWTINIGQARQMAQAQYKKDGNFVALQGNLDPMMLTGDPTNSRNAITQAVRQIKHNYGQDNTGHIFNLGHGISQHTPIANVETLIEAIRNN